MKEQMVKTPVYLDNQATTPVDPAVLDAMLPFFTNTYGNAGSTSHPFGWDAKEAVEQSRERIAQHLNCAARELVFTSGATESNNLALRGLMQRRQRRGNHVITVRTEHKAVLDPLRRFAKHEFDVTFLDVEPHDAERPGWLDPQKVKEAIRDDTLLVSVMLANNEIGIIQPLREIADICHENDVYFHSDATQAVGKTPVDVDALQVDLMSFSAHKIYGPKGVGGLYVRRRNPRVRLEPQIDGGGQEGGRRSGTLNVPGIVGLAKALDVCMSSLVEENARIGKQRDTLFEGLSQQISEVTLNGPALRDDLRLAGNLNCSFANVDGEALMMSMGQLAVSSGSACTSENPEPSHVLRALGLSEDLCRASLRFGVGRFTTDEEISFAIDAVREAVFRLRAMI